MAEHKPTRQKSKSARPGHFLGLRRQIAPPAVRLLGDQATAAFKSAVNNQGQKPSNARPTQLTANAEDAITATDARVAMALTDDITGLHFDGEVLARDFCPNKAGMGRHRY
ncbi:MAG: hypothetical protein WDN50_05415 [Bradyrhizobium sp.]